MWWYKTYTIPYLYGGKESLNIWYNLIPKAADLGVIALIKEQAILWIYVESHVFHIMYSKHGGTCGSYKFIWWTTLFTHHNESFRTTLGRKNDLLLINLLSGSDLMPWGTCRGWAGGSYQLQPNTWDRGRKGTDVMYQSMRSGSVTEW